MYRSIPVWSFLTELGHLVAMVRPVDLDESLLNHFRQLHALPVYGKKPQEVEQMMQVWVEAQRQSGLEVTEEVATECQAQAKVLSGIPEDEWGLALAAINSRHRPWLDENLEDFCRRRLLGQVLEGTSREPYPHDQVRAYGEFGEVFELHRPQIFLEEELQAIVLDFFPSELYEHQNLHFTRGGGGIMLEQDGHHYVVSFTIAQHGAGGSYSLRVTPEKFG